MPAQGVFRFRENFCILITSKFTPYRCALTATPAHWKRRLLIIRFESTGPGQEKYPDFKDVLIREEGSGILNWASYRLRDASLKISRRMGIFN